MKILTLCLLIYPKTSQVVRWYEALVFRQNHPRSGNHFENHKGNVMCLFLCFTVFRSLSCIYKKCYFLTIYAYSTVIILRLFLSNTNDSIAKLNKLCRFTVKIYTAVSYFFPINRTLL